MRRYPAFELEFGEAAYGALKNRVSAISVGDRHEATWLRDVDGNTFAINVNQRDLEFKFEVFSLAIEHLPETTGLREFAAWPFRSWRTEVLRRDERIVEDVVVEGAFGEGPHSLQSAEPPGAPTTNESAACEVAAGFLFTGPDDHQLLIAVDWMPFWMITSQDQEDIRRFTADCEFVGLDDYAKTYRSRR